MVAWCALLCLLAVSVGAVPTPTELVYPEQGRNGVNRIVSGWEANDGEIPYQLSLRMVTSVGSVVSCGATLIHNEWALTAAHCTANRVTILIRAGGVSLVRPTLFVETTEYYNHPQYIESSPFVQPNDLGVIKFQRPVEYTPLIQPIRLQSSVDRNRNYDGVRLMASGWGRTWTNSASPTILNWVYLSGVSNQFCRQSFGGSSIVVDSTICARGYNVTSQSTCQGDSGGPLVVEDVDGVLSQVGISSFVSSTGCHTDFPAGFIRPGHYHDWITEVTGINLDWDPNAKPSTTTAPEVPTTVTIGIPTTASPEVPTTATIGIPTTVSPEVPTTASPEVPTTASPEVPTTASPEVPTTASPEVPTTASPEVPTTAFPEVPTTASPEVPTTISPEVPTTEEPSEESSEEESEGESNVGKRGEERDEMDIEKIEERIPVYYY